MLILIGPEKGSGVGHWVAGALSEADFEYSNVEILFLEGDYVYSCVLRGATDRTIVIIIIVIIIIGAVAAAVILTIAITITTTEILVIAFISYQLELEQFVFDPPSI